MTIFNIKKIKTIAAVGTMVFFVSCSNDPIDSTGGIVDNVTFKRDTIQILPEITTVEIASVRSSNLSTYLLGQYNDPVFGKLKSDFVGQVTLDKLPDSIGNTLKKITASLEIPLNLIDDGAGQFEIANFLGDSDSELKLEVRTFTTFLELISEDKLERRVYNSDGTNDAGLKDTLGIVKIPLGVLEAIKTGGYVTSDKKINIPLDSDFFKNTVLDKLKGVESLTDEQFITDMFKGVKIDATTTKEGIVAPFDLVQAKIKIAYENDIEEDIKKDAKKATVGLKKNDTLTLSFDRVNYNLYTRERTALNTDKVYVQGAAGYELKVDISKLEPYKEKSKSENWFLNQAILQVSLDLESLDVDPLEEVNDRLEDFYIYGVDNEGVSVALSDYGLSTSIGGVIREDDTTDKPFIQFAITNYIKQVLSEDTAVNNIVELRIKSKEALDNATVDNSSTTAKTAVFINDISVESKNPPILELIYSKNN